jgi:hypothetical protein
VVVVLGGGGVGGWGGVLAYKLRTFIVPADFTS